LEGLAKPDTFTVVPMVYASPCATRSGDGFGLYGSRFVYLIVVVVEKRSAKPVGPAIPV
jgi:hypothetical protein